MVFNLALCRVRRKWLAHNKLRLSVAPTYLDVAARGTVPTDLIQAGAKRDCPLLMPPCPVLCFAVDVARGIYCQPPACWTSATTAARTASGSVGHALTTKAKSG